jgi:hypothetical protein
MATQAALIADTIIGMKRALRRERDGMYLFLCNPVKSYH